MKNNEKINFNKQIFGVAPRNLWGDISNLLFIFLLAVIFIFIAFSRVYTGTYVKGPSMMPTINKDYLTAPTKEDIAYCRTVDNYDYGDIVIIKTEGKEIIKRVVGRPGDYIEIKKYSDGKYYLYRNAERIVEDFIYDIDGMVVENEWLDITSDGHLTVATNQLFVMGDNRGNSKDSTYYGCFNYSDISGRVDFLVEADENPFISIFLQMFFPIIRPNTIV